MPKKPTKVITAIFPDNLVEKLDRMAQKTERDRSKMLRHLVEQAQEAQDTRDSAGA